MANDTIQNLIYTGTRSGSIFCFDLRIEPSHRVKLFDSDMPLSQRSSMVYLNIVNEWQLLVSQLNGHVSPPPLASKLRHNHLQLATYDLRFARSSDPIVIFPDHVNSHTRQLASLILSS
jgi:DDB1- and CUL4-associated factor 4